MDVSIKLSEHLEAVARLMDIDEENPHKVRAYLHASLQVRGRSEEELKQPLKIPGVGPSIGTTIKEFLLKGTSTRMQTLSERWPVEILSLMQVQGVGPRKAVQLFESGITSFEELAEKAKEGQLSAKLTESVLATVSSSKRIPIEIALGIASEIKKVLLKAGGFKVEICGSVRRFQSTCKDIDVVVQVAEQNLSSLKREFENLGQVLWSGPVKSSIMVSGTTPIQCDLWTAADWHWGASLNYVTGSKQHNVRLRSMLKSRGMRLNEYGIYIPAEGVDLDSRKPTYGPETAVCGEDVVAKRVGGTNEEDVYRILGIPYVQPSQRNE